MKCDYCQAGRHKDCEEDGCDCECQTVNPSGSTAKNLVEMTEPELKQLTTDMMNAIESRLPKGTCFMALFWPVGEPGNFSLYGSNAQRAEMIQVLCGTTDRLDRRQYAPLTREE